MSDRTTPPHLKLVASTNELEKDSAGVLVLGTQSELFPMAKPHLLIFADVTNIPPEEFVSLISEAKPSFVFDLRPTPRFDFGRLNRKTSFELFRANGTLYVDVTGLIGVSSKWDANLNPSFMVKSINEILKARDSSTGPLVFLFDDNSLLFSSIQVFADGLDHRERKKWEVCLYP